MRWAIGILFTAFLCHQSAAQNLCAGIPPGPLREMCEKALPGNNDAGNNSACAALSGPVRELCENALAGDNKNCRDNASRMKDIRDNLRWCTDPANHAGLPSDHVREKIIWGRYNLADASIRDAYGVCQRNQSNKGPYSHYESCNAESFLQAARDEYPDSERAQFSDILSKNWGPGPATPQ